MADPIQGAEKGVGGAAGFVTKRIGPLPLWAWAAGAGVAFLALKAVGRGGSPKAAAVTGPAVATTSRAPSAFSPGAASGGGSFVAPAPAVAPPIVNVYLTGYSQPNGVTGTPGAGWPSDPIPIGVDVPALFMPNVSPPPVATTVTTPSVVTTKPVTAPSSGVGATPVSRPLPVPQLPGTSISVPVVNAPAARAIVSAPTPAAPYENPGGAVAPGQKEVARIPGSGGGWISIFGRS